LPVEVVALEDVAEQMGSQVLVRDGREVEQRPLDRPARQLGLVGRASGQQGIALRDRPEPPARR